MRNLSDILTRLRATLADRYHLERELGSGGMAIVYLAEDLKQRRCHKRSELCRLAKHACTREYGALGCGLVPKPTHSADPIGR
jgi:hypothetical protein